MERINFTSAVLGAATARLRHHAVTQTLRSERASITQAVIEGKVQAGDTVEIVLDGSRLGTAQYDACLALTWASITDEDARLGGFDSREELEKALLRAGYRFTPAAEWRLFRHQFTWLEEVGDERRAAVLELQPA
jgi:hypothetical protein